MPQSLARILVHLVFSTKDRAPRLDATLRPRLHEFLGGILRNHDCPPIRVGGVADHVHLLFVLSRTTDLANLVSTLKAVSSPWIKSRSDLLRFHWQNGYAAFSVSPDQTDPLIAYIENQEAHHRKMSYKDELLKLLRRYGVDYDEKHLWD